jgi:hypothetical protein
MCVWIAQLKLAILALVYVQVGVTITHIVDLLNDCAFSLQKLEVMQIIHYNSHNHRC